MLQPVIREWGSISTYGAAPMDEVITIGTSLTPGKNVHNQRMAVNSWLKLGFHVVSINSADEMAILQPYFPDIEFVRAQRDGRESFGKPYIYFDDFLAYFATCDSKICGIVNSDIYLLKEKFYSFLKKEAMHSFIYGSRVDVETLTNLQGKVFEVGFDYFFFNQQLVSHYPPTNFLIGLPMWDYWVVLIPIYIGIPVKKVITPHAYHIIHETNWDRNSWQVCRNELIKHVKPKRHIPIWKYAMYIWDEIIENSIEISLTKDENENH